MANEDSTLFDENPTTEAQSQTDTDVDEGKKYFEELVGEGKKFSDPESLARGKWQSDRHIENLQRENAEMRSELRSRVSLEKMLKEIRNENRLPDSPTDTTARDDSGADNDPNETLTTEKLEALLESKFSERETRTKQKTNLEQVKGRLNEEWGPGWTSRLREAAQDLGVEPKFLDNLGATQPKALYKLLGLGERPSGNTTRIPTGETSNERRQLNNQNTGAKNFRYYEALRKSDPNRYFSLEVSQEMIREAERQGESFYS